MSKYEPLWNYIKSTNKENLELSFDEITKILGFKIDHSFLRYKTELQNYGFKIEKIFLKKKQIFVKKIIK